jgi:hypothetical protein
MIDRYNDMIDRYTADWIVRYIDPKKDDVSYTFTLRLVITEGLPNTYTD